MKSNLSGLKQIIQSMPNKPKEAWLFTKRKLAKTNQSEKPSFKTCNVQINQMSKLMPNLQELAFKQWVSLVFSYAEAIQTTLTWFETTYFYSFSEALIQKELNLHSFPGLLCIQLNLHQCNSFPGYQLQDSNAHKIMNANYMSFQGYHM